MALGVCRECGRQVSSEAAACPHCGAPRPTQAPTSTPEPTFKSNPSPPDRARRGGWYVLVVAVLLLGSVKLLDQRSARRREHETLDAWAAARRDSAAADSATWASDTLALVPPAVRTWRRVWPSRYRMDRVACASRRDYEAVSDVALSGDTAAFTALTNGRGGCTLARPGTRVFVEAADRGLLGVRPEGEPGQIWMSHEAFYDYERARAARKDSIGRTAREGRT